MNVRTFPGGAHPPENKSLSENLPIEAFPAPEELLVPFSQHIGAPAVPTVKPGDDVLVGQLVGQAGGFVSCNVHSPVSGKVKRIVKVRHPLGHKVDAALIANDGNYKKAEGVGEERANWLGVSAKEIIDAVQEAGIAGMGGAAFPTHVKLAPPPSKPIDTVILNAAECEPYLTCDCRLLLERTADVVEGLKLILRALTPENTPPNKLKGIVAVEANKKEAYGKVSALLAGKTNLSVVLMPVKYPQGAEKQLIKTVLGRDVPPLSQGGLPMDVGVVVQNVGTAIAVYEAVRYRKPLYERVLTVTGDGVEKPGNLLVRIGTPVEKILHARGLKPSTRRVISGGPMMGIAVSDLSLPVAKGTSGIVALTSAEHWDVLPCISCGACVRHCPMRLIPSKYSTLGEAGRYEETEAWNVVDCIECGVCTYVCPSKRPIVQHVKVGKSVVLPLIRARAQLEKEQKTEAEKRPKTVIMKGGE